MNDVNLNIDNYNPCKRVKCNFFILNATHYVIRKIPNKEEFQQNASNYRSEIEFDDFLEIYR